MMHDIMIQRREGNRRYSEYSSLLVSTSVCLKLLVAGNLQGPARCWNNVEGGIVSQRHVPTMYTHLQLLVDRIRENATRPWLL